MMHVIRKNEYIILLAVKKTARVIEIYTAPGENDSILFLALPDGETTYAFSSQVSSLDSAFKG